MYRQTLLILLISISVGNVRAQQPQSIATIATSTSNTGTSVLYNATNRKHEAARAIVFNEPTITSTEFLANINGYFDIPAEFSFAEIESNTDNLNMRHHHMQQFYKGIPLEGLGYRVHEKNGFVTSANGKAMSNIDLDISTLISEEQAFILAVQYLQTRDSIFRSGKKLIVSKNFTFAPESFSVAFQFDIDVSLIEQWRISIDARSGAVINKVSLVQSCSSPPPPQYSIGTGLTNYYGSQTIRVNKNDNGSSRLQGQTEHGGNIEVYDFENRDFIWLLLANSTYTPNIFYSGNNIYDSPYERPAVSVQWATEQAYEYYFTKHNRNSFDNNGSTIKCYVHVGQDLRNAYWTRNRLAFGASNNPLVELDVVGHEFTHGVTQYEAALRYSYESGALNESFSDIFGKAIEFHTFGDTATWQLSKYYREGGLRDMSNPNLKNQPDTYLGDLWFTGWEDNGGVHYNSGVQNFWFYLLCEGGSGINDNGVNYSVNSIGMDTAVNIAYRNLTEYLIYSSDYLDSRIGSLLATADLYGKNSSAYQEVEKAWDAVGVIDEPIITSLNLYDVTATTVKLNGSLLPRGDTVTYHFEYGTTPAFGNSTSVYKYSGTVEGLITGLQSETKYYVRLVATNENGSSFTDTVFTTISLDPLVEIEYTVDVTETNATLHGQVNPNSLPTLFYFEYGPTPDMGLVTPHYPLPDTTEFLDVSALITGLQPRQTYYYKLIATNSFASSVTDSVSFFTAAKPVISSFAPVTATIGTEITITGQYFHSIPEMNWVNFGATRAIVVSSSSTEMKVKVPTGASFGPISVLDTESGLVGVSSQEFVPTFTGEFSKGDYQLRAAFDDIAVWNMSINDMDGDGRPDIVTSNYQGITVFQNVNTGGDITNESFIQAIVPVEQGFLFHSLVDIDGNGFKDMVGYYRYVEDGYYQYKLRIYPNFSVPGYIFFGVPVDVAIEHLNQIIFNDFDNDGHIDIAGFRVLTAESSEIVIYRNQSPKGLLLPHSFEQQYSKILPNYIRYLNVGDLNNDVKPDMIMSVFDQDLFIVLNNKSYSGFYDLEETILPDSTLGRYGHYFVHDLNQDVWKDIASFHFYDTDQLRLFENKGSDITLSSPIVTLDGQTYRSIQPGDINGNGKVDLLVGDYDGRFFFLKNEMIAREQLSDSSFLFFEHYGTNDNNREVASDIILNDLNGDGRPEVINNLGYGFGPHKGHQLEIWQNSSDTLCLDPTLIEVIVTTNTATIVLPPNSTLDDFEIEYFNRYYSQWYPLNSLIWSSLNFGATYQVRARAKCYLGFTNYHYIDFITECVDLSSFSISNIQINNVWLSASNLSSIEVEYSEAGKNQWVMVSQNDNQISNLFPGTTYDLRYRGRCNTPGKFNFIQFTTLCPTLSSITIGDLTFNKAVVNWTSSYVGDAILEYSTDNLNWTLIDETRTLFPLIPGKEYFVRGSLACTNIDSDFIYTSFSTPCPKVSMLTVNAITPFNVTINWADESDTERYSIKYETAIGEMKTIETNLTSFYLDGLTPGTHYTISVAPKCISVKDFTSITFTTLCYAPFNLLADAIAHTTAELSWEDNLNGFPYTVDYSIVDSDKWLTTESVLTTVMLEELRPGTKYEARVHINCLGEMAQYASIHFETSLYEETIIAPNPTENLITIYPSKKLIGNQYDILDINGNRVAQGKLLDYTFDLSTFPIGVYILRIEQEKPIRIVKK